MRLKERRDRVKSILQHKPDSAVADGDIDRAVVDASAEVWDLYAWNFAIRTAQLDVIPDITPATVGGSPSVSVANNQRRIVFSAILADLLPDSDNQVTAGRTWVGQVFSDGVRDYRISEVTTVGSGTALVLEEPYRIEESVETAVLTDWTLKWMEIPLPGDVGAILGLQDADTPATAGGSAGKLPGLPERRREECDLRYQQTGTPQCYFYDTPTLIPAAGRITAVVNTSAAAPSNSLGFSGSAQFVELTWAFCKGGKIGPLAEPVTVEVTGQQSRSVTLTLLAEDGITAAKTDAPDYENRPFPTFFEGWRKRIFFNSNVNPSTGDRKGIPCWREVNRRSGLTIETEVDGFPLELSDLENTVTINQPHQISPGNRRLRLDPDGSHPRIALWPRPADSHIDYPEYDYGATSADPTARKLRFRKLLCRYKARPFQMAEAGESDELPTEFHIVTVWKAAASLLRATDAKLADSYENRANAKIAEIQSRHLSRADVELRRGQWDYATGSPRDRWTSAPGLRHES